MSTIDSKQVITQIMDNNGYYQDDPRVYQIVKYVNASGNITWGVTWENEPEVARHRYEYPTDFILDPTVIWNMETHGDD